MNNNVSPLFARVVLAGLVLIIALYLSPALPHPDMRFERQAIQLSTEKLPGIDWTTEAYTQRQEDISYRKRKLEEYQLGNHGMGITTPVVGQLSYNECYTCKTPEEFRDSLEIAHARHYLALAGFSLRQYDSHPQMIDGEPWIQYTIWDRIDTLENGERTRTGHMAMKPVHFRYAYKENVPDNQKSGWVLIPISAATSKWLGYLIGIVYSLVGIGLLYYCIILPALALLRVARGQVFSARNHRQILLAGKIWFAIPFVVVLLQGLLALFFIGKLTSDLQFVWWSSLRTMLWMLVIGLILAILAQAFKRGLALQNEQALTI